MAYKVQFKKKGGKKWFTCKGDDWVRNKYFTSRSAAKKYAKHLTSFQKRVVSTKK
jgi:hypothetical protein